MEGFRCLGALVEYAACAAGAGGVVVELSGVSGLQE